MTRPLTFLWSRSLRVLAAVRHGGAHVLVIVIIMGIVWIATMSAKALPSIPTLESAPTGVQEMYSPGTTQLATRQCVIHVDSRGRPLGVGHHDSKTGVMRHGAYEVWSDAGYQSITGQYNFGKRHGIWTFYGSDGKKVREELWIEGTRQ